MNRLEDHDGDLWPITGDWCTVCRLPLIKVDHRDTHPTCDPRKEHDSE